MHPQWLTRPSFMLEATPKIPYEGSLIDFLTVERNMALRRRKVRAFLKDDEFLLSLTNFPR